MIHLTYFGTGDKGVIDVHFNRQTPAGWMTLGKIRMSRDEMADVIEDMLDWADNDRLRRISTIANGLVEEAGQ